jgi:hypothetical protein
VSWERLCRCRGRRPPPFNSRREDHHDCDNELALVIVVDVARYDDEAAVNPMAIALGSLGFTKTPSISIPPPGTNTNPVNRE